MDNILKCITKSWQTSLAGLLTFITISWPELQLQFDADPETVPDWNIVMGALMVFLGLLRARDNHVTSEQAT